VNLRVLHTIGEMGTGGAESLVVELVRRGAEVGWTSDVASAGGHREDELVAAGAVGAHRVPLSRRRPLGFARALQGTRTAIRRADPDVVIAHNVGVTAASWLALRSLNHRAPLVTVFHGVAEADYRHSARLLSRAPDAVITVSGAIRSRLEAVGLRARRVEVIPNAVTPPSLPPQATAREELGLPQDVPVALCLARLAEQKRHDVLLRAWALVPEPAVLLIAGDGPTRDQVARLRDELGLAKRVQLLGARSDVPRLLAAATVTTLASDWEGLPVAVLESMAAGRPVVATAVDGLAEALRDGGGLLVPRRDPRALAEALTTLLDDPRAAGEAGARALGVISDNYDPGTMMRRYDRLLRDLLTARPTARGRTAHSPDHGTDTP